MYVNIEQKIVRQIQYYCESTENADAIKHETLILLIFAEKNTEHLHFIHRLSATFRSF